MGPGPEPGPHCFPVCEWACGHRRAREHGTPPVAWVGEIALGQAGSRQDCGGQEHLPPTIWAISSLQFEGHLQLRDPRALGQVLIRTEVRGHSPPGCVAPTESPGESSKIRSQLIARAQLGLVWGQAGDHCCPPSGTTATGSQTAEGVGRPLSL